MSDHNLDSNVGGSQISLEKIPRAALQAIYHQVTGKTETLSKPILGNVLINFNDVSNIHEMIMQKIEHYDILAIPTVTITLKQADNRSLRYSSWERFRIFSSGTPEITSELILKYEFVLRIANTQSDQRCIINVAIDSGLPLVVQDDGVMEDGPFLSLIYVTSNYRTVFVSIDFVDFLIAKIFMSTVEEWFKGLQHTPRSKIVGWMTRRSNLIGAALSQIRVFGSAIFLSSLAYFAPGLISDLPHLAYALSVALVIWGVSAILTNSVVHSVTRRISKSTIPSVILLTDGDKRGYDGFMRVTKVAYIVVFQFVFTLILSIGVNLLSSYIFSVMNAKVHP